MISIFKLMTIKEKVNMSFNRSMPGITLREKLEKRAQQQKDANDIDWEKRKRLWIDYIKNLYDTVESWLHDYVDDGYMAFNRSKKKTITEKDVETYEIEILEIDIEGDIVVFDPVGTNIIGAWGRVDVYLRGHKADKVMLFLYGDENEPEREGWILLFDEYRFDFNKARLEELLLIWFENWSDSIE
jgi:hypothetical protein